MIDVLLNASRFKKQIVALMVDVVCLPLVFCLAIALRYDSQTLSSVLPSYYVLIAAAPLLAVPIFIKLGLYRAVIRFIEHDIVYVVVAGVSLSVLLLLALAFYLTNMLGLSRGVFGIYWISAVFYVLSSRFLARAYLARASGLTGGQRVAIYGAGRAGAQLSNALSHTTEYKTAVFIDDDVELQGTVIAGVKVHPSERLEGLVASQKIKVVMLAMPSLSKTQQKRILERLEPLKIKIKMMPSIKSMVNFDGEVRLEDVREIEIEDLLGRDAVDPELHLISKCITGKTVMVTGAGGSIGSELCRQILRLHPRRLVLFERSEFALYQIEQELQAAQTLLAHPVQVVPLLGSVLDEARSLSVLSAYQVETLYHAAAYKHVPLVEHNPIEGVQNNVLGTLCIARSALKMGVQNFVLISTDKAVHPTNVMGATKRMAELILQALSREQKAGSATQFSMVRFGNVLGSSGSVVPLFRKQILEGGPLTITHAEITRYFMTIPEAAQLVLQASAMASGGDVFVLDMGEPVKIIDLAKRMVHLSGLELKTPETPHGTIEIRQVGLRPGEKLYEELLIGDHVEGTAHPLIMRAQEAYIEWPVLQGLLSDLSLACEHFDHREVRAILKRAVIEYAPQGGVEDFVLRDGAK